MKVLVATKRMQGKRKNDFSWAEEGELVKYGMECDGESVDGGCGCRRALCGMKTSKATTTMLVMDMDITKEDYRVQWLCSMKREGWIKDGDADAGKWCDTDTASLLDVAAFFPVGTVLEKRGNRYQARA